MTGLRAVWRLLIIWAVAAATLLLLAWALPGFAIDGVGAAFVAAGLLGLLNALVWPVLVWLTLPLTTITLGLVPLILNVGVLALVARLLPTVSLDGFWPGLAVTVGLTAVAMLLTAALAMDDDSLVLRQLTGQARKLSGAASDVPGVLFLQIDGLGLAVLQRAVRDGNVPALASWIREGTHRLVPWTTDWSSQTGASQAGILLGSNDDMPAFRWMEKESGGLLVSNRPRHAAEIERRHSTGKGLLHEDGASRGNIFTGDADDSVLTMASAGRRRGRIGAGYYAYFSHPQSAARTLLGTIADIVRERHQAAVQRHRDVRPRVHRGGFYPLLRAFTTVITRDVIIATLAGDMQAGRSVVYADFVGYDEVAHHSGVERYDAMETLRRLDRELGRLERLRMSAPRPYELVVLSDHGQSQGATFLTRYGETLAEVVRRATVAATTTAGVPERSRPAGNESRGYAVGALEEIGSGSGLAAYTARRASAPAVAETEPETPGHVDGEGEDAVVLASGNCGLVYLTKDSARMSAERITELYPGLLPSLRAHPGIGFCLVRSAGRGPLVLSARGELELETGLVVGEDPLRTFGPDARRQVARTDTFEHCPDIMVNSLWERQTDEVAAFEELVGSHGGLGGEQTHPFLLYPSAWPAPEAELFGAEAVHRQLGRWLGRLGHIGYDDGPEEQDEREQQGRQHRPLGRETKEASMSDSSGARGTARGRPC
jgi:uncharacterized membrane protein YvlD (DUF360 family)